MSYFSLWLIIFCKSFLNLILDFLLLSILLNYSFTKLLILQLFSSVLYRRCLAIKKYSRNCRNYSLGVKAHECKCGWRKRQGTGAQEKKGYSMNCLYSGMQESGRMIEGTNYVWRKIKHRLCNWYYFGIFSPPLLLLSWNTSFFKV